MKKALMTHPADGDAGFTIIELMVTIFVAALFMTGFITLTTTYNYFMALTRQTAVADNLAYGYVQKYTRNDYTSSQWFVCSTMINGKSIESGSVPGDSVSLPDPVTYDVTVSAPYGCFNDDAAAPVKVDATVTYGLTNRVIHHVSFAKGIE